MAPSLVASRRFCVSFDLAIGFQILLKQEGANTQNAVAGNNRTPLIREENQTPENCGPRQIYDKIAIGKGI